MHLYGIWNHFEVFRSDKITWGGSFLKILRGARTAFSAGKMGGRPFLTGAENTEIQLYQGGNGFFKPFHSPN
jgi:hypothetical protein